MTPIDRGETRRRAQGAIDAERRAAIGPITLSKARPVLAPREVIDLLDALERAEGDAFRQRAAMNRERDRAVRAEAQSETRRQQTVYWKERAEGFEAKMNELDRAYISEHGQRRRAEDEQDRLKGKLARRSETVSRLLEERNNAEARIKHLESTAQVLVREALQAEKARDEHRRERNDAEARIQAVRDLLDENPAAYARTYNHHVRLALDASPD